MSEVVSTETERQLRKFLQLFDFCIVNAKRTVEINRQIVGARQEYPGDPILMQAAFGLTTLESLRGKLLEFFPILLTSGQESDGALSSTEEE